MGICSIGQFFPVIGIFTKNPVIVPIVLRHVVYVITVSSQLSHDSCMLSFTNSSCGISFNP